MFDRCCMLCGSNSWRLIHHGTRDKSEIDVLKCEKCGLVTLSEFPEDVESVYADGGMHVNAYDVKQDKFCTMDFERWREITAPDDDRRYEMLKSICMGKNVLEFGCGNGGFLKRIAKDAKTVVGIELEREAVDYITSEGFEAYSSIDEMKEKCGERTFDVVVGFMVIEHLTEPYRYLDQLKGILVKGGTIILSTVNADDALITYYDCKAFQDFTYWSEHVYLYDQDTLSDLMTKAGFEDVRCEQVQRYSLANHLYWLNEAKPGGHQKYIEFNQEGINKEYTDALAKMGKCDSIMVFACKR